MLTPRISVIIPAYNASGTIMRLIASLQSQSLENFEAIIINDGSTDDTTSIVQKCVGMDKRFKLISTTNGGVSRARNIGIDNATTRFCTFIDAETTSYPQHCAHSSETMKHQEDIWCAKVFLQKIWSRDSGPTCSFMTKT